MEIRVYDNHFINIQKYPRLNTSFTDTDKIIINFLLHEKELRDIYNSVHNAIKFYNECKDYYFIFKLNNLMKKYEAKDIINLMTNNFNNIDNIDKNYITYIQIYPFYINLFKSIEEAKKAYFERRDFIYTVHPPNILYENIKPNKYQALDLLELNTFVHFLKNNNYKHDLPLIN